MTIRTSIFMNRLENETPFSRRNWQGWDLLALSSG